MLLEIFLSLIVAIICLSLWEKWSLYRDSQKSHQFLKENREILLQTQMLLHKIDLVILNLADNKITSEEALSLVEKIMTENKPKDNRFFPARMLLSANHFVAIHDTHVNYPCLKAEASCFNE